MVPVAPFPCAPFPRPSNTSKNWVLQDAESSSKTIRHLRITTIRSTTIKIAKNMLNKNHFCYTNILVWNRVIHSLMARRVQCWTFARVENGEVGIHVLHRQGGLKATEEFGNSYREWEVSSSWQVAANLQRSKDWERVKIGLSFNGDISDISWSRIARDEGFFLSTK